MTEFIERPITSQDKARGNPELNIAIFFPVEAVIQPLANEPMTLPTRKSVAKLNIPTYLSPTNTTFLW